MPSDCFSFSSSGHFLQSQSPDRPAHLLSFKTMYPHTRPGHQTNKPSLRVGHPLRPTQPTPGPSDTQENLKARCFSGEFRSRVFLRFPNGFADVSPRRTRADPVKAPTQWSQQELTSRVRLPAEVVTPHRETSRSRPATPRRAAGFLQENAENEVELLGAIDETFGAERRLKSEHHPAAESPPITPVETADNKRTGIELRQVSRNAMVCALVSLVLTVLLAFSSSGAEPSSPCPPQWLPLGQRCFAFYPVWSSWTTAKSMCSQTGGDLASLHTPEERSFVEKLASTHTPVWLGGHQPQQNGAWNWTDGTPFRISGWTNQELGNTREACLQMEPKSGELHGAPCGELRFYICSTKTSSQVVPEVRKPPEPGIVPNVSLFDVMWSYSDSVAEEILRSSSFLKELWSGHLTPRRYASFMQQEALYLHRVSSTLEALLSSLGEAGDVSSLLQDTLKDYSSRNQSLAASPAPQWLHSSLQSFHSVVLEEPVYWLVALSARACLWGFLAQEQPWSERWTGGSPPGTDSLYQEWREESLKEVEWTQRYRKVIEKHQDQMDVFKAVNIFREHMMNQKSFYKMLDADVADDRE